VDFFNKHFEAVLSFSFSEWTFSICKTSVSGIKLKLHKSMRLFKKQKILNKDFKKELILNVDFICLF